MNLSRTLIKEHLSLLVLCSSRDTSRLAFPKMSFPTAQTIPKRTNRTKALSANCSFLRTPRSFGAIKKQSETKPLPELLKSSSTMVAPNDNATATESAEVEKPLSPKQLKRLEEQKAREEKKMAKRKEKALQKERKMAEKEAKDIMRERKMEELRLEKLSNKTETPKKLEEAKRLAEEKALFEKEFIVPESGGGDAHNHVKKSALESNRLGGLHMA